MKNITTLDAALKRIEELEKRMRSFKKNWSTLKKERPVADRSIMPSG